MFICVNPWLKIFRAGGIRTHDLLNPIQVSLHLAWINLGPVLIGKVIDDTFRWFKKVLAFKGSMRSLALMSRTPRFKPVKTRKGWRLNIPAVLSATGKRSRRFFKSRELTEGFAQKLRVQIAQHGTRILPPAQADAAVRAFKLLGNDATPEMLLDAVRQYVKGAQLTSAPFENVFEAFASAQPRSASYNQSLRQFRARLDRVAWPLTVRHHRA